MITTTLSAIRPERFARCYGSRIKGLAPNRRDKARTKR
jgi:hypothetical protein